MRRIRTRTTTRMVALTFAAATSLVLAGCTSDGGDDGGGGGGDGDLYGGGATADDGSTASSSPAMTAGMTLSVAETDLGTVVVDGDGNVVYQFDSDTQGGDSSTCVDACATNWPAVPATEGLDGVADAAVTGEVGSITGIDGEPQLTLNGWPLYYFAGDTAAGDVAGQGVNDVWWVLTPDGEPVRQ